MHTGTTPIERIKGKPSWMGDQLSRDSTIMTPPSYPWQPPMTSKDDGNYKTPNRCSSVTSDTIQPCSTIFSKGSRGNTL
jgi:hypothetical protein